MVKKSGTYKGKSNALGYGGRAQQLKDQGVPGGVIGDLARKAEAAPGQKNYHGKKAKKKAKPKGGGGQKNLMNAMVKQADGY